MARKKARKPSIFLVEEMADISNVYSFFVHRFLERNGVHKKKLRGKPFHRVDAKTFAALYPELLRDIATARDDRNTRDNPDRVPTIENLMYKNPEKRRFNKFDTMDIERRIIPGEKTETGARGVKLAEIYRANIYRDQTISLDKWDRTERTWKRLEPIKRKEFFIDWVVKYDLDTDQLKNFEKKVF